MKDVPPDTSDQLDLGKKLHQSFEDYTRERKPLPPSLAGSAKFIQQLHASVEKAGGTIIAERKVALNRRLQPTEFFADDVWWRGVIDWTARLPGSKSHLLDYKTGKFKNDTRQLTLFGLYELAEGAQEVTGGYYWTQTHHYGPHISLIPEERDAAWARFAPDLNQYYAAYKADYWPKKPSGLCGWCPVKDCEFWKERRR